MRFSLSENASADRRPGNGAGSVSGVPGVISCDQQLQLQWVSGGGGSSLARGSVKYHLPWWSAVSRWVGVSFQRGVTMMKMAVTL